jgi:hypothetical protein
MQMADPQQLIASAPPGTMIYALGEGDGPEVALLIREEPARVRGFGPSPRVELRLGLYIEGNVALIPLMVGVGSGERQELYETWINAHQLGGGWPGVLRCLEAQGVIRLLFFGDGGSRERAVGVPNRLGPSVAQIREQVARLPEWSMGAFDTARERIYQRYPSVKALWGALGANK